MKIFFTANVLWDIYIFRGGVIKALVEEGKFKDEADGKELLILY